LASLEAKLVDGGTVWYGRRVRGCRASIVAAVLFLAASIASPLGAAEPTNDNAPGIVVFAVDPQLRDAQAMVDAVRAHLTGLPVRLVIDTGGAGSSANRAESDGGRRIGTLTIDPATPGEWVVSFTEPAIDTTLVRRIRLKPQGMRVALEEAAIVVRSMVEAMLDGGHVGIARPARLPEEGPVRRSSSPWPIRRHGIAGTAGYLGTTFAPNLGWQSALLIGLRWQFGELYAGTTYALFNPITTDTRPASLLLVRHPAAIVVGYAGGSRVAPTIEIEMMADYVLRTTMTLNQGYVPTSDASRWNFGVGAQAGISWSVLPWVRLFGQAGIDWIINPYSYVALSEIVVETSSVRPKIGVGLGVDLW
jgi:hypothetical protein